MAKQSPCNILKFLGTEPVEFVLDFCPRLALGTYYCTSHKAIIIINVHIVQIKIIFHLEKNLSAQVLVTVSLFLREFSAHGASYGRSSKELHLGHSATYHFWKDLVYPLLLKAALKAQRRNRWWPSLCLCSSFLHPQCCVINIWWESMVSAKAVTGCPCLSSPQVIPAGPLMCRGLCPAHPVLHKSSYLPVFHLQLMPKYLVISCHLHKHSQGSRLYQGVWRVMWPYHSI